MDTQEKIDAEKTDIKKDAEKAEKVSKEEDKDYKVDASKDTNDREKTIKDDAEKSERLNDEEKKDYKALKQDYSDLDQRYPSRDEYNSLVSRLDALEKKGKETPSNPYDAFSFDVKEDGEVK